MKRLKFTKRQRELIASSGEKCGALPLPKLKMFGCQMPKGHRGKHVMEIISGLGRIAAIFSILLLVGCAHPVKIRTGQQLKGQGWIAAEQRPDEYLIVADDNAAAERATKEICSHSYTCTVETVPARYVTRRRK